VSNILKAFINIVNNYQVGIKEVTNGNNRANNMGEGLENYIKNAFADNFKENDIAKQKSNIRNTFSYIGTKNNPPDIILKKGDAIEVKKVETIGTLQFNSSHPKAKLKSNNSKIKIECKRCGDGNWIEKDILYSIGHIPKETNKLKSLWFVYGTCYAADENVYQNIENKIKAELNNIDGFDANTNELGRVNNIDSLDITYLRIRGMWVIKHPAKVFNDLDKEKEKQFNLIAIIPLNKYNNFPKNDKDEIEKNTLIKVQDEIISDPNNAAKEMHIKLLLFKS
jgi:hypothetical protein